MAETKKMTNREVLNYMAKTYANDKIVVEYSLHQLELLDKKASAKTPSKVQIENEKLKDIIFNTLVNLAKPCTISEIQDANSELMELSNQKMTNLLTQLKNEDKVVRTVDKKKAYFKVAINE